MLIGAVCLAAVGFAGCASTPPAASNAVQSAAAREERVVFVTLGGSETLNRGMDDSLRRAWAQQVFTTGLPRSAVYVNLANDGATVRQGLDEQVPKALELKATIATVWFGRGDGQAGTTSAAFSLDLTQIVQRLHAGGVSRVILLTRTSATTVNRFMAEVKSVGESIGVPVIELPRRTGDQNDVAVQAEIAEAVKAKLPPGS